MEEKITLDRSVFRSLASKTKIDILKSIDERRKTLSELSKELGMSVSTIKEHLDGLVKADLVEQIDDGHKWKYYELTRTGNEILHPGSRKIMLILSAAILSIVGIFYDMLWPIGKLFFHEDKGGLSAGNALSANANIAAERAFDTAKASAGNPALLNSHIPWIHIILLVILAIIIGGSLVYIFLNRRLKVTSI